MKYLTTWIKSLTKYEIWLQSVFIRPGCLISLKWSATIKWTWIIPHYKIFLKRYNKKSASKRACIDTLRWDAIDITPEMFDIDSNFREMVKSCLKSTSFATFMEGSLTNIIIACRCVREGDPPNYSHHYCNCLYSRLEYLSRLIKNTVQQGRLKLYIMGGVKVISYLTFVNVIFFSRASRKSFQTP